MIWPVSKNWLPFSDEVTKLPHAYDLLTLSWQYNLQSNHPSISQNRLVPLQGIQKSKVKSQELCMFWAFSLRLWVLVEPSVVLILVGCRDVACNVSTGFWWYTNQSKLMTWSISGVSHLFWRLRSERKERSKSLGLKSLLRTYTTIIINAMN